MPVNPGRVDPGGPSAPKTVDEDSFVPWPWPWPWGS